MKKRAQYTSMSSPSLQGRTLEDLYREIRADPSLSSFEQRQILQQIAGVTGGAPSGTPLGILMARGLGGVAGWLISKYFGMGVVGQTIASALGIGLGKSLYDTFNAPSNDMRGWHRLA